MIVTGMSNWLDYFNLSDLILKLIFNIKIHPAFKNSDVRNTSFELTKHDF